MAEAGCFGARLRHVQSSQRPSPAGLRPDPLPGLCREFRSWHRFVRLRAAWEYELDTSLIDN